MDYDFDSALQIRRDVLGREYVDRILAGSPFTAPFQEFVTRYAWGEGWSDDSIDLKTRSLITVAVVTALGQADEVRLHVGGALRNGCTADELAAVLKHVAIYAGVARAVAGIYIADAELSKEADASDSSTDDRS
ncbi:MAG: 4-carboxymuconolactone decarboxylase [Mycobacterium sp.]|jgi:alkylhydroperoxidase/carboxymuconolactone decarboxylase family protein YurZ|uniref:carboxymuconolactone decarboxylase family protein n=1 Tax=Mycobacterium sp. TaxID=1785 RepID=UPI0028B2FFEF|nr:carboxymuconolactone decarboxylase family protein [Mycobacterium sp.]MDT5120384.1 4-carboxymuconolactone decarboxylase [Mycobacterium sp.]